MPRSCALLALIVCCTSAALAAGTVTFTLESPSHNQTVAPGTAITWTLKASVSTGDNVGLALFAVDLVQDPNNPAFFDLPPGTAASIPTALQKFNRPAGITNPGEGGAASGYIGVQRGTVGQKNLVQIGGAQNTFGQAGTGFATDPVVVGGIGQSGAQILLTGTFNAPATGGVYKFNLANAIANVLTTVNTPPNFSPVTRATSSVTGGVVQFTVSTGPKVCKGDMNCDGVVDFKDINPFVAILSGSTPCLAANADCNNDGVIDFKDINPFVALLSGGTTCP
jgi:hypothetical protein